MSLTWIASAGNNNIGVNNRGIRKFHGPSDAAPTGDVVQILQLGRANDRRADARLGKQPGDGDLTHAYALLFGELLDPITDSTVL